MQTTHLGHGQLTLGSAPIITFSAWDESLKADHKIVHGIGMKGISKAPASVTINVTNAVPQAGEQFDYPALVIAGTILDMSVYETAAGKVRTYRGVLKSYDRNDGVDTEPTAKISFEGTPL